MSPCGGLRGVRGVDYSKRLVCTHLRGLHSGRARGDGGAGVLCLTGGHLVGEDVAQVKDAVGRDLVRTTPGWIVWEL